jgi:hypothetical protein
MAAFIFHRLRDLDGLVKKLLNIFTRGYSGSWRFGCADQGNGDARGSPLPAANRCSRSGPSLHNTDGFSGSFHFYLLFFFNLLSLDCSRQPMYATVLLRDVRGLLTVRAKL